MSKEMLVTVASHYFCVSRIQPRVRVAIEMFARKFIQYGFQRSPGRAYARTALKVFAAATADRSEYRFHIRLLKQFEEHIETQFIPKDAIEYLKIEVPHGVKVDFVVQPQWEDRDYQTPVIDYLAKLEPPLPVTKLVQLQTGKGKSYCAMRAMQKLGLRTAIIVRPMYIEKWVQDLHRTYDIGVEEILVIRGSTQLMATLMMAEAGELMAKVIVISNKTYQNWLTTYEKLHYQMLLLGYVTTPDKLFDILGCGIRLIDEVHQDFHLNFKIDLYTNVEHAISLSASMQPDDKFLESMIELAYPLNDRYHGPAYHKYVNAYSVVYRFSSPGKIRFKDHFTGNYSHHLLEQSILKNDNICSNYLELMREMVQALHMKDYKETQKCLIYCKSIDMCTVVSDYFRQKYPNLNVKRYVEEDPFENLMTADICVSTVESAGTGMDIPNLKTVLLTVALSSSQSNIQGFGRLRELKDGTVPVFAFLSCEDIPKHMEYQVKKHALLESRAMNLKTVWIGKPL